MFGLVCKGLHCAGCGKGVPAGIVVILVIGAATRGSMVMGAIARALEAIAVELLAIGAIVCAIAAITGYAIYRLHRGVIHFQRWDGPTTTQKKMMAEGTPFELTSADMEVMHAGLGTSGADSFNAENSYSGTGREKTSPL